MTNWNDLNHKASPERRAEVRPEGCTCFQCAPCSWCMLRTECGECGKVFLREDEESEEGLCEACLAVVEYTMAYAMPLLTALAAYGDRRWTCCGALRRAGEDATQEWCPACLKWNAEITEAVYGSGT